MKSFSILGISNMYALACGALFVAAGTSAVAIGCASDPKQTPPAALQKFQPEGCGFEVATRAEYPEFQLHKAVVSAAPNIERVRLGLGGNVEVGAAGHADPATSAGFGWQTDLETL